MTPRIIHFLIQSAHAAGPAAGLNRQKLLTSLGGTLSHPFNFEYVLGTTMVNSVVTILSLLAIIAMIYAGFLYITAGDDSHKMESAKKTIIMAGIGIVILIGSWFIIRFAGKTATGLVSFAPVETAHAIPTTLRQIIGNPDPSASGNINRDQSLLELFRSLFGPGSGFTIAFGWIFSLGAFGSVLYSSYLYLTAYGDETKAEKGKKALILTVIGIVLGIVVWTIINTLAVNDFRV